MIVVDSSGRIEFFADGPRADLIAARIRSAAAVLTPTLAIYEVYKWIKRERWEDEALQAVAAMKRTRVVDLDVELALSAADLSLAHDLRPPRPVRRFARGHCSPQPPRRDPRQTAAPFGKSVDRVSAPY